MKEVLRFLSELKENNNKEWFDENRKRYEESRKKVLFLTELINQEIAKFDPEIGIKNPKDCVFRIIRDVRFSNDKTPYKTNMGSFIAKDGRKSISAGYYMHMGFWGADQLKNATDAAKGAFLDNIRPGSELMICLERMAKMFFSLGLTVLGVGLALGKVVPRWLGVIGAAIGMAGMMTLFAVPFSHTVFIPFDIAIATWLVVLGALVSRGVGQESAG